MSQYQGRGPQMVQHHEGQVEPGVDLRPSYGRVTGRDRYGRPWTWEPGTAGQAIQETVGKLECAHMWPEAPDSVRREFPGWAHAWPAQVWESAVSLQPDYIGGPAGFGPTALPMHSSGYPDPAFRPIPARVPPLAWPGGEPLRPTLPSGTPGVMLAGSDHTAQQDIFLPAWTGALIAQTTGDRSMSTLVFDIDPSTGQLDPARFAPLDTLTRVVGSAGGMAPRLPALALNWTPGQLGGYGGLVYDRLLGFSSAAGVGSLSAREGGALTPGVSGDRHARGTDSDGLPVGPMHLWVGAPWIADAAHDGPLGFESLAYEPGAHGPGRAAVTLRFDPGDQIWKWTAHIPFEVVAPQPPPAGGHPPGGVPGAPGGPGGGAPPPPANPPPVPPPVPPLVPGPPPRRVGGGGIQNFNPIRQAPRQLPPQPPAPPGPAAPQPWQGFNAGPRGAWPQPPAPLPPLLAGPGAQTPTQSPGTGRPDGGGQRGGPSGAFGPGDQFRPAGPLPRPWATGDGHRPYVETPMEVSVPSLLLQAPIFDPWSPDPRQLIDGDPAKRGRQRARAPMVGRIEAITGGMSGSGAGIGYTQQPCAGRYPGGTASGMLVLLPPEADSLDLTPSTRGIPTSTTHLLAGPGTSIGVGTPNIANGQIAHGYTFSEDQYGSAIQLSQYGGGPTGNPVWQMAGGWMAWKGSSAGLLGSIWHQATGPRQWMFPDTSGTVALASDLAHTSKANKAMAASVTVADFNLACATPMAATPALDGYVQVLVNGCGVEVGDGAKTKDCYFSADGGATARAIVDITAGDMLYWVGSVVGYQLAANDAIDFDYMVT